MSSKTARPGGQWENPTPENPEENAHLARPGGIGGFLLLEVVSSDVAHRFVGWLLCSGVSAAVGEKAEQGESD